MAAGTLSKPSTMVSLCCNVPVSSMPRSTSAPAACVVLVHVWDLDPPIPDCVAATPQNVRDCAREDSAGAAVRRLPRVGTVLRLRIGDRTFEVAADAAGAVSMGARRPRAG